MPQCLAFSIADVRFALSSEHPLRPLCIGDPYTSFTNPATDVADLCIPVKITGRKPPSTKVLQRVFEADDTWALFRKGDMRVIRYPSDRPTPFCHMVVRENWRRITIHVDRSIVTERDGNACLSIPFRYPLDQVVLMNLLAGMRGVIVHSCGVNLNGKGPVFLAKSGGGKTTLARLLAQHGGFRILSDDRIIVRDMKRTFQCFGTPWPGVGGMALNERVPLRALFFLAKGSRNRITPLTATQAIERLLPVTSIPWYDIPGLSGAVKVCEDMAAAVPCYELQFRPDGSVADLLVRHVKP